ncbi:hypothetical protein HK098_006906 [Nowakowskiella sp. JEL0407]|nr:hypothetical protein HK098_006906 [Nowakowskiella sp. JEL0407]
MINPDPPAISDLFYMPFTNSTDDNDLAVLISFELKTHPNPVMIHRGFLLMWEKSGDQVLRDALSNMYEKATTPIPLLMYNNMGVEKVQGMSYRSEHFAICYKSMEAEVMLLPYLLMPVSRILKGDLVVINGCNSDAIVMDTYICGSNDLTQIHYVLDSVRKPEPRNPRPFISRAYRLKATEILSGVDDGDDWTFGHQYHSIQKLVNPLFQISMKLAGKNKDLDKVLDYLGRDVSPNQTKPSKKSILKCKQSYPTFAGILDDYFKDEGPDLKYFPFHMFFTRRFMVNYRYEWTPYELPSKIPRDRVNLSYVCGRTVGKDYIVGQFRDSPDYEKLLDYANRRYEYLDPEIAHLNSEEMHECSGCGITWIQHKKCGKCRVAWYCSVNCQKRHWKKHREICFPHEISVDISRVG